MPGKEFVNDDPCCAARQKYITTRGKAFLRLVLEWVCSTLYMCYVHSATFILPLIPRTNGFTGLNLIILC